MLTKSQTELRKPSVRDMWIAGYRQHPVTKEWLPREQVIAVVEAMKTQLGASRGHPARGTR